MPSLVNLNLEKNYIKEIEAVAFDGLTNLRVLNLADNNFVEFYFNLFESAANNLGSPVNLMSLCLDAESINLLRWSTETAMLVDEGSMLKAKEKKKIEADEAAQLFAKCGFRNRLDVELIMPENAAIYKKMSNRSFLEALAARNFVRLSFAYY
jgi:Leucine-rich repeat (LRR) protein